jgi:hypothetical protein
MFGGAQIMQNGLEFCKHNLLTYDHAANERPCRLNLTNAQELCTLLPKAKKEGVTKREISSKIRL